MADKKDTDTGRQDDDDQHGDDTDDDDGDDEEEGWQRLQGMIDNSVKKGIDEWSEQQAKKTTSTRSPRKEVKTNPRKTGFLSSQFFSGLNPDK